MSPVHRRGDSLSVGRFHWGPCPQTPFGYFLQQIAFRDIPLPLKPLASSPSTWEVSDSSVLVKEVLRISHNSCVPLLVHYSQSRKDEQLSLPGGTGADLSLGSVRRNATPELCCCLTCLCTVTPRNTPKWGLLPPEAVTQAPALLLPLIYCSPLP